MTLNIGLVGFVIGGLVGLVGLLIVLIPALALGVEGPPGLVFVILLGVDVGVVCGLVGGAMEAAGGV